ncbi:hypothetical protein ADZ36_05855 [Streptomyces fradiae]|uniref:Uncharacterized protein n=1 Tax=Streptomyces fradiae TaxID=1906 RepID=A0ACC4WFC1_STRFR|nr:hypothetical protein ADZ36_05855 [Streptomyces fradiae]OFA37017.1 hypothetical protein BEN35_29280 [Streptomyces fradiae]PQM20566.1 hypothetical protein Sfr7A_25560 [Streptomyces xinghaiensis]
MIGHFGGEVPTGQGRHTTGHARIGVRFQDCRAVSVSDAHVDVGDVETTSTGGTASQVGHL